MSSLLTVSAYQMVLYVVIALAGLVLLHAVLLLIALPLIHGTGYLVEGIVKVYALLKYWIRYGKCVGI